MLSQALCAMPTWRLLRKGILDACDAQDGLLDGLVSNPAGLPASTRAALQCSGTKTDTLPGRAAR